MSRLCASRGMAVLEGAAPDVASLHPGYASLVLRCARDTPLEHVRAKLRTWADPPGAAALPDAWASGSSLRAAPVSARPCARGERLRLSRGSCAPMVFHTPCGASFHEKRPRVAS